MIVHEPPLLGAVAGDSRPQPAVEEVRRRLDAVAQQLRAQDVEGGARRFVEEVALGPGWWEQLPEEVRRTMVDNAPTFVDTLGDPGWADLDLETLSKRSLPVLLTEGDQSPSWLPTIVAAIGRSLGGAERQTFVGAGHVPHLTHPGEFVRVVRAFIGADSAEGVLVSEA